MYTFDRQSFETFKAEDKKGDYGFWSTKNPRERLEAAYYLICTSYAIDPDDFPRMDKTAFEVRKRQ